MPHPTLISNKNHEAERNVALDALVSCVMELPLRDLLTIGREVWRRTIARIPPAHALSREQLQKLGKEQDERERAGVPRPKPPSPPVPNPDHVKAPRGLTIDRYLRERGYCDMDIRAFSSRFSRRLTEDFIGLYGRKPPKDAKGRNLYTEESRNLFDKVLRRGNYPRSAPADLHAPKKHRGAPGSKERLKSMSRKGALY